MNQRKKPVKCPVRLVWIGMKSHAGRLGDLGFLLGTVGSGKLYFLDSYLNGDFQVVAASSASRLFHFPLTGYQDNRDQRRDHNNHSGGMKHTTLSCSLFFMLRSQDEETGETTNVTTTRYVNVTVWDNKTISGLTDPVGVVMSDDGYHLYTASYGSSTGVGSAVVWFTRDPSDGSLTFQRALT